MGGAFDVDGWVASMANDPREWLLERIKILCQEKEFYRVEVEKLQVEVRRRQTPPDVRDLHRQLGALEFERNELREKVRLLQKQANRAQRKASMIPKSPRRVPAAVAPSPVKDSELLRSLNHVSAPVPANVTFDRPLDDWRDQQ